MKSINNKKMKIDRRYGINLWGRAKSPVNTREYGPGEHGQRRKKPTDYAVQLHAKQKLKTFYGNISEKRFAKYYAEAIRRRGDAAQNLIGILESRLDAVVYHSKFVPTVFASRQFINHGHILVNGKKVNVSSYVVKAGDVIEVAESSRQIPMVIEAMASQEREVPEYIESDEKNFKVKYSFAPKLDDVPYPVSMEPNLVIEFYSR